jgi:hypothetical protein
VGRRDLTAQAEEVAQHDRDLGRTALGGGGAPTEHAHVFLGGSDALGEAPPESGQPRQHGQEARHVAEAQVQRRSGGGRARTEDEALRVRHAHAGQAGGDGQAARQVQVQPLAMEDEERRGTRLTETGEAHHLLEAVFEDRDQHRRRERRDRIGQHLADVGPRELLDARVERGLAVDGDGPRLQQDGPFRADGPLDVLRTAEEVLGLPRQAHDRAQLVLRQHLAVLRAAVRPAPEARLPVEHLAPWPDEAGDESLAAAGVRLDDEHGRVARVAGEDDPGLARLHEPLDEDGDGRRLIRDAEEARIGGGGGGPTAADGLRDRGRAPDVELGAELAGEARLGRILRRGRRAHRHRAQAPAALLERGRIRGGSIGQDHEPVRHGQARAAQARQRPGLGPRPIAIGGGERVEPHERAHHGRVRNSHRTSTVTKERTRCAACGLRILNRCQLQAAT